MKESRDLPEEIRRTVAWGPGAPFRVVGTMHFSLAGTAEQLAALIEVEALLQRSIGSSSLTALCSWQANTIREDLRNDWFLEIIANHHSAIFAPKANEGTAFDMR